MTSQIRIQLASYVLFGLLLLAALYLHLLPALIAGLVVYELTHTLSPFLGRRLSNKRARMAVVIALALLVSFVLLFGGAAAVSFLHGGGVNQLIETMARTIEDVRQWLPNWLVARLPDNIDDLEMQAARMLRENSGHIGELGKRAGVGVAHVIIGMVIGGMVALHESAPATPPRALAAALIERGQMLAQAFHRFVFAQVRISALNTVFTGIYLLLVLPEFGIHLPLSKTLVALTFITGLLPVIGNVISNTVIVVISVAVSPVAALGSLLFLVLIHKLEYFLNARIVGGQIHARAWELLLAMLLMEAAFGLPGLVAAPIYYAWLKSELLLRELI